MSILLNLEIDYGLLVGPFAVYANLPDMVALKPMTKTPEAGDFHLCRMRKVNLPFTVAMDSTGYLYGIAENHYLLLAYDVGAGCWVCTGLVNKNRVHLPEAQCLCGQNHIGDDIRRHLSSV